MGMRAWFKRVRTAISDRFTTEEEVRARIPVVPVEAVVQPVAAEACTEPVAKPKPKRTAAQRAKKAKR